MHDETLHLHKLSRHIDAIRAVSRPCLVGSICDSMNGSYFGGLPLVPDGFQWPTKEGYPLAFVGQIRCADIEFLPTDDGDLLFFYDNRHWGDSPRDRGHAIVVHVPSNASRVQAELPTLVVPTFFGLFKKTVQPKVYRRVDVQFSRSSSYPSYERGLVAFQDYADEESYSEFCLEVQADIQLGGFPSPVQSDTMEQDCVEALGMGTSDEWVLLLQLFEIGDMFWGDAGALYWFIHQDDLANSRFDRVWMVTQCH